MTWSCSSLQCTCRPGAAFCGGGSLNLTNTIDSLNGDLTLACDPPSSSGTASCNFQQSLLESVFGSSGLSLTGCTFGECVRQGVIDTSSDTSSNAGGGGGNSLSGGVIGGLATVGALIALALFGLFVGWWTRRKQRRLGAAYIGGGGKGQHGGFAVEWSDISYVMPQAHGSGSWLPLGGKTKAVDNGKVILDGISGRVEPGQLLGILGPSGAHFSSRCEVSVPNNTQVPEKQHLLKSWQPKVKWASRPAACGSLAIHRARRGRLALDLCLNRMSFQRCLPSARRCSLLRVYACQNTSPTLRSASVLKMCSNN